MYDPNNWPMGEKRNETAKNKMENTFINAFYTHIQSIRNKVHEIELTLMENKTLFEILCFTEHWLHPDKENSTVIEGYKLAASYSKTTAKHGGVCIYINNLNF